MISALEAKLISKKEKRLYLNNACNVLDERKKIDNLITCAAKRGEGNIKLESIYQENESYLRKLGFEIFSFKDTHLNQKIKIISWS